MAKYGQKGQTLIRLPIKRQADLGLHFSSGTFNSELWVINLLVLRHSGNMKRSGFQSKAIPKVSDSFYYIIMLTCCVETTK